VAMLVWYVVLYDEKRELTVAFLDIGQGDSIFIESPNGNQMLVDGGPNARVLRELGKLMPFYDRTLDIVLATHPDQDHIGGLPDVLKRYTVKNILRSGAQNDTNIFRALNEAVEDEDAPTVLARRWMLIDFGDGVYAEVLSPDRDVSHSDPNDASVVLHVIYGSTSFLLTGDAPQAVEHYLVSLDRTMLQSDVLKAGHHGSKTSSSQLFLGFVSPEYGVISAGRDNRYGHPHQEVLDRFAALGIPIMSTATSGTIVFRSNRTTLVHTP